MKTTMELCAHKIVETDDLLYFRGLQSGPEQNDSSCNVNRPSPVLIVTEAGVKQNTVLNDLV